MLAIHLNAYGDPDENLELVDLPEPPAPGPGEVLVGVEFSPINPADLLLAMGYYALRPTLPSVIGNEGVGIVLAVGDGVTNVRIGDRVIPPLSSFLWRERLVIPAKSLAALPQQADLKQLAMLAVNPVTAALLLSEFKTLKPGRLDRSKRCQFRRRPIGNRLCARARPEDCQYRSSRGAGGGIESQRR